LFYEGILVGRCSKTNEEIKQNKQASHESVEIGKPPGLNLIQRQREYYTQC